MAGTNRANGTGESAAANLRRVLEARNLSLHRVSDESLRLYGTGSPSSIPHTLYHSLTTAPLFSPSLPQIAALSRITGYRIEDWLALFGIELTRLAGLQSALPLRRTTLIDPIFVRAGNSIAEPVEFTSSESPKAVLPFGKLVRRVTSPLSHQSSAEGHSLFARVGSDDAFAYPELLPGSIVRADPQFNCAKLIASGRLGTPSLLLIEHDRGLWCGRFHVSESGVVHAASSKLAYAQIAFQFPREARVLGIVDTEVRWINRFEQPNVPRQFSRYWQPGLVDRQRMSLSVIVRRARSRSGLTLSEASELSRVVSQRLADPQFAIARATLAEYEVQNTPPRQLKKVITLCVVYGMRLMDFVAASGTAIEFLGQQPIPAEFMPECGSTPSPRPIEHRNGGPDTQPVLANRFGEIPWFLGSSLPELSGISRPQLRDCFWLNGEQPFLPGYTRGSLLAVVNRRKKKPIRIGGLPTWQQPAFVLLLRNGDYLCACCSLHNKTIVLYPESQKTRGPEKLRLGEDVEVVGQIVALVRRIE
jgi:hypothetical protein